MKHLDHVNLLRQGIDQPGGVWADLGSGTGAFTLALADLIGPKGKILSIDRDGTALREQRQAMRELFPKVYVDYRLADFTSPLDLPPLDGLVMANSLHFHRQKGPILAMVQEYLKPGGVFLLVEYNSDQGNPWVPYPLSYTTWEVLARRCQFVNTRRLATYPSRFTGEMYSAGSRKASS
jgi:ubiquinone/menaquinone biosynthesis C-methylase UbiE